MAIVKGPTAPGDNRPQNRSNLDEPPPSPPNLRTPDYSNLASDQSSNPQTPPTGELAAMVIERGALALKVIESLATMVPGFAPIAAQMSAMLQGGLARSLQGAQGPPTSAGAGSPATLAAPLPMGGGGAPGGAGAGAPPPGFQ